MVSILATEVSVAFFTVSVVMVESEVLFIEKEESTFAVSVVSPDFLPLHAETEIDTVINKIEALISVFMVCFFICAWLTKCFY